MKTCEKLHSYPKELKCCPECKKASNKAWYETNKEQEKAYMKAYHAANLEHHKANHKAYYNSHKEQCRTRAKAGKEANKEQVKANHKAYYNSHKEQVKANMKVYKKANPAKMNAHSAKRRAAKRQAIPRWLTEEHEKQIQHFYDVCAWLNGWKMEKFEVDHIVPLQGEEVCGLHVPWNLQLLPASLNRSKGNKHKCQ